jgi:flavin-binding protein dodecin
VGADSTANAAAEASKTLDRVSASRVEERNGEVSAANARAGLGEIRGSVGGRR